MVKLWRWTCYYRISGRRYGIEHLGKSAYPDKTVNLSEEEMVEKIHTYITHALLLKATEIQKEQVIKIIANDKLTLLEQLNDLFKLNSDTIRKQVDEMAWELSDEEIEELDKEDTNK